MNTAIKTVAVYGSSGITQESDGAKDAYRLGRLLGEAGYNLISGGYMGVMEACSKGAKETGAHITGVACKAFTDRTPNPYLDEILWTGTLPQRIATLMENADAYIVLDGNVGTIAELLLAWNIKTMGGTKPVIVVGEKLKRCVYALSETTEVSDQQLNLLDFVNTIEEAVDLLKKRSQ